MNTGCIPHLSTGFIPLPFPAHLRDNSPTMAEGDNLFERIDALRRERGIRSERALSIRVTGKPDFIRNLKGGSTPKADNLDKLAEVLGTTTDYLLGRAESPDQVRSEVALLDRRPDLARERHLDWRGNEPGLPGIPIVGTGDCAELEVCDESGNMVSVERSSFDPDYHVRMIARPPALQGARNIYAIQFHGSSMEPRFEPSEIGIVDPNRPVARGDYVLIQLTSGENDEVTSVLVKRLVRQTAKEYVLEQFNPPLVFTLAKAKVARIHRIMRQTDFLF
jgi:transcriptional regulator with XRE-family HTH domain